MSARLRRLQRQHRRDAVRDGARHRCGDVRAVVLLRVPLLLYAYPYNRRLPVKELGSQDRVHPVPQKFIGCFLFSAILIAELNDHQKEYNGAR